MRDSVVHGIDLVDPLDLYQLVMDRLSPRAVRRRFDVFEYPPSARALERYYVSRVNDVADLVTGFESLNAALKDHLDRHHAIGHAFLMVDPMTSGRLQHLWNHKIGPLIEEYFFDQHDVASEFHAARFWPSLSHAD